jgi:hypothetical protein
MIKGFRQRKLKDDGTGEIEHNSGQIHAVEWNLQESVDTGSLSLDKASVPGASKAYYDQCIQHYDRLSLWHFRNFAH